MKLMQSLNLKQNELCTHVLQAIDTQHDPIHIFIECGAGVVRHKWQELYINQ